MKYTKEAAELKFPGVVFGGDGWVGAGAVIEARAVIGAGAVIEAEAYIKAGAVIEAGAVIGAGAVIASIYSKYSGNIIPMKDKILIRIGCETHPVDYWMSNGEEIAKKHGETKWWNKHGKSMLEFLKAEAKSYQEEFNNVLA